jgi:hypothetical protein
MAFAPEINWSQYEQVVVIAPRLGLLGFVSTRALFCTIFFPLTKSTASSTCELPSSFCIKQRHKKSVLIVSTKIIFRPKKIYSILNLVYISLFFDINNFFRVSFHLRSYLFLLFYNVTKSFIIIIVSF